MNRCSVVHNRAGLSLIETIVWMAIFTSVSFLITSVFITSLRSQHVVWDQLNAQSDGRRTINQFIKDVRKAEESSLGAFPISLVTSTEFIFYANIDDDTTRERVRYVLQNNLLYRGIIEPSGSPLSYAQPETMTILARDIVNTEVTPLFSYYDEQFTGTSTPLSFPITLSDVRMVRIQLQIERDLNQSPVPFSVEGLVHIRNLKQN